MRKTGLGKGLGALIGTRPAPVREDVDPSTGLRTGLAGEQIHQVGLSTIIPSPLQAAKKISRPMRCKNWSIQFAQHGIISTVDRPARE